MLRWYCDLCGKEIEAPDHPEWVKAYRAGQNRDQEGWGRSEYFVEMICHKKCADVLETEITSAPRSASLKCRA